jgi:hypothetical protein
MLPSRPLRLYGLRQIAPYRDGDSHTDAYRVRGDYSAKHFCIQMQHGSLGSQLALFESGSEGAA